MQLQLLRFGQIGLLATGLHVMIALAAAEFLRFTDRGYGRDRFARERFCHLFGWNRFWAALLGGNGSRGGNGTCVNLCAA